MRYLVEFAPNRQEEVYRQLKALGLRPTKKVIDKYWSVEIPTELVSKVEALPGVIRVVKEETYSISTLPVEAKLKTFLRLGGPTNPIAMAWVTAMGLIKDRWPTSESRKVLEAHVADKMGISGKGVNVAVLDTGVDIANPQVIEPIYSVSTVDGDPIPIDNNGHGTWCIACIGGRQYRSPWGSLEGVAKRVELGSFKCLGYGIGSGSTSDVMEAIAAAYNWGAKIISMSLGSDIEPKESHNPETCPLCSLITALSNRGVIFCIAAGNSGKGYASCPGASPGAITVAALKKNLTVADFSSREHEVYLSLNKPDVGAPGVDTGASSTGLIAAMEWMDGFKTAFISGTSMATPHVSGLMSLWTEYARINGINLTKDTAMDIIKTYGKEWRSDIGYGVPKFSWIVDYLR